jgi:hypothetical protein
MVAKIIATTVVVVTFDRNKLQGNVSSLSLMNYRTMNCPIGINASPIIANAILFTGFAFF